MLKVLGWQEVSWNVQISWSKNASLPIIAASLFFKKVTLHNVPRIWDVFTFLELISSLWVSIDFTGNTLIIENNWLKLENLKKDLIKKIRVWIFLLAPLLKYFWNVEIPYPGWCNIGKRPIDEHLEWLTSLWYKNKTKLEKVHLSWKMSSWYKEIIIDWFSVTATETVIIASVLRNWTTKIYLWAMEPHVIDLINFLNKAWANIILWHDHTIIIKWVESLKDDIEYTICNDYIESGTFIILWALASKEFIDIKWACINNLKSFLNKLKEVWVKFKDLWNDVLRVYKCDNLKPTRFQTNIYPWFPTDLQSPFCVLLTQADGISRAEEIMYEWRLNFLVEIEKMKWHPAILNPHEALIFWKTKLSWATVSSWDLRAWVAMIIAWIIAKWETYITNVEYIDRGYEDIIGKIKKLWVLIERV